jgi:hypothetical protein
MSLGWRRSTSSKPGGAPDYHRSRQNQTIQFLKLDCLVSTILRRDLRSLFVPCGNSDATKARVNLLGANRVLIAFSHSSHRRLYHPSIFDRIEWPNSAQDCHQNLQKDHSWDHQKDHLHASFNEQARNQERSKEQRVMSGF